MRCRCEKSLERPVASPLSFGGFLGSRFRLVVVAKALAKWPLKRPEENLFSSRNWP